jgi:hypothetical protein
MTRPKLPHRSRHACLLSLAIALGCWSPGYSQVPQEVPVGLQEAPRIGLAETLARAFQLDPGLLREKMMWWSSQAEIDSIRFDSGWDLELGGEQQFIDGSRRETRDESLGRSPQDIMDDLNEEERFLFLGLTSSFLDEKRKRKKDMIDEDLRRIDDGADIQIQAQDVLEEIVEAYLDCFQGNQAILFLSEEIDRENENLRTAEERYRLEEALRTEVLKIQTSLAGLHRIKLEWELRRSRGLDLLRSLWSQPDLDTDSLAPPELSLARDLGSMALEELTRLAWEKRPDVQSKRAALAAFDRSHPYVKNLPEVDVGVSARYGDYHRDFADEGREDSGLDVRLGMEVRIPLSLSRENQARERQFQLERRARAYEVRDVEQAAAREVRIGLDEYVLAREEERTLELAYETAREELRLLEVTVAEMPETLGADAFSEVRKARKEVLAARLDWLQAGRDKVEALAALHVAAGEFAGAPTVGGMTPGMGGN